VAKVLPPPVPGRGSRRYRLTGTGAFETLFRTGRRREGAWLQIVSVPAHASPGRVGFVIGAKALRRAVDRNRVRRALREVMHRLRPPIEAYDVIVRLKRACARHEVSAVAAEAVLLLTALLGQDAPASSV